MDKKISIPNPIYNIIIDNKYLYIFIGENYDSELNKFTVYKPYDKIQKEFRMYFNRNVNKYLSKPKEKILGGIEFYENINETIEKPDIDLSNININITESTSTGGDNIFYVPMKIYYDDNITSIKQKIEHFCRVQSMYQLLVDEKNKIIGFTHDGKTVSMYKNQYTQMEYSTTEFNDSQMIDLNKISDYPKTPLIRVITLSSFILENENTFISYNHNELKLYYDKFISYYWPHVMYVIFDEKINGKEMIDVRKYSFDQNIKKIYEMKPYGFDFSDLSMLKTKKSKTVFQEPLDLYYIFDQYTGSILFKIDEGSYYLKYQGKRPIINKKILPKQSNALFILDGYDIISGRFIIGDVNKVSKIISSGTNNIVKQIDTYGYSFGINIPGKIDYKNLALTFKYFGSDRISFETEYYSSTPNAIIFYYTKINVEEEGALVNISGQRSITCTINNVLNEEDAYKIYRYILRIFTIYLDKVGIIKGESGFESIHTRLKDVDPVLFDYNKIFNTNRSLYSRICQKNKQPIVFYKNSIFLDKDKFKPGSFEEHQNYTYSDQTMVYVCPEKKYNFLYFLEPNYHPMGFQLPCCGRYPRKKEQKRRNNLYYVKQFNENVVPKSGKMCYMPQILNDFFNEKGRESFYLYMPEKLPKENNWSISSVINSILGTKYHTDSLMVLMRKLIKKNILLTYFEYNDSGLKLKSIFTSKSVIASLESMKIVVLVSYGQTFILPVVKLIRDDKKYSQIFYLNHDKHVYDKLIYLYNGTNQENTNIWSTIGATQIIDDNSNVIGFEYENVRLPVFSSYFDLKMPYKKGSELINKRSLILEMVPKKQIAYQLRDDNGYYIGFEFTNGLYEFHKATREHLQTLPTKNINYIREEIIGINILSKTEIDIIYELYQLFVLHFSTYLNEIDDNGRKIKIDDLYNTLDKSRYQIDIVLVNNGKRPVEYFKKNKSKLMSIIDNPDKVTAFIDHFVDKHISGDEVKWSLTGDNRRKICGTSNEYTIENQCKGNKLVVGHYVNHFSKLLKNELLHNPFKSNLIINNKLTTVIDPNKFSEKKGYIIEKIYVI